MSAWRRVPAEIANRGLVSPVWSPRVLFSLRAAGLECSVFGVRPVEPDRLHRAACGEGWRTVSSPRIGVPLVESADERERQKGPGICPGQGIEP